MAMLNFDDLKKRIDDFVKKKDLQECYRNVFGTKDGQRVLADMCARAKVGSSCVAASDNGTYMNLGANKFMLDLLGFMGRKQTEIINQTIQRIKEGENTHETQQPWNV